MHRPARRFVLRAAALPFATLEGIDRTKLRALVEDPAIAEAIYLAAPDLAEASGENVDRALHRYIARMAGRATPFGLFSGVTTGDFGDSTRIAIGTRHRRQTRLDTDYLARLCERLAVELRDEIAYAPNSSLYRMGERLRYVEVRIGPGGRAYHLVAIDASPYVEAVLARGAATLAELAATIEDPELTRAEIAEFVETLVVEQVLRPMLQPPVTGPDPTAAIIEQLRALPSGAPHADALAGVAARLAEIDLGAPADYRALAEQLGEAGTPNLFQVDLALDAEVSIGPRVAAEIARGVEMFRRLLPPARDGWAAFRQRFTARYETREVPLVEVLDDESGIGFLSGTEDNAPLLEGLPFPARPDAEQIALTPRHAHLVRLLSRGGTEIVLDDADLAHLASPLVSSVDTFVANLRVVAASPEAADAGDFRLWIHEVTDQSATRPLGRFCNVSPEIDALTRELARAEERLAPDALFAEIAHFPEGRAGNILMRPVLRGHEIAVLGASGIAPELQIPVAELMVSIESSRVVIRWRGREIRPAMATAHNYMSSRSVAVYRFLAAHATQGAHGGRWSWGVLDAAPFLPRVRHGKTIVTRARWLLERDELAGLTMGKLAALRVHRRLPRWIALSNNNSELPLDLENPFAEGELRDRRGALVYEWLGSASTHVHEIFVPFIADRAPDISSPRPVAPAIQRRFPPGSRWLYAKLYGGTSDTDELLGRRIAPFVRDIRASGLVEQFFFIRYADPEPHLRLRFAGDPARLAAELLPRLGELADDRVWRVQLDTYERELERYGDIEIAERIFAADSEAVLEIIEAGREPRWQLALRGIDRLLADLGLDLAARATLVTSLRDSFGAEHGMDAAFQRRLGIKYRAHADEIAALLVAPDDTFARRSLALAGLAASPEVAGSHTHMHVNRMLPAVARKQELVLYDLLRRHYARSRYLQVLSPMT